MPDVIRLPVTPAVHLRAGTFSVAPIPDRPGHYNWACGGCIESGCARTPWELGDHLTQHLVTCPG